MNELENIKVGDKVVVKRWGKVIAIATVDKTTPKQIIVENNRYWKKDGMFVGGYAYHSQCIDIATEEILDKIRKEKAIREAADYLNKIQWSDFDLEALERIINYVKDEMNKTKSKQ